jgi:hypothetical protein
VLRGVSVAPRATMMTTAERHTAELDDGARELLALIERKADRTVAEHFGVRKSFLDEFLGEVTREVDRLHAAAQGILAREFRKDLDRLVITLRAMVSTCRRDPEDINMELALASIVRDIADAADEYGAIVSKRGGPERHAEKLAAVESNIREVRLPWARKLLERMTANDAAPAADRLQLSSAYFESAQR